MAAVVVSCVARRRRLRQRVVAALQVYDYGAASATLTSLQAIEVIDNVRVTRLLARVRDTVRDHVQALEREATTVMAERRAADLV